MLKLCKYELSSYEILGILFRICMVYSYLTITYILYIIIYINICVYMCEIHIRYKHLFKSRLYHWCTLKFLSDGYCWGFSVICHCASKKILCQAHSVHITTGVWNLYISIHYHCILSMTSCTLFDLFPLVQYICK